MKEFSTVETNSLFLYITNAQDIYPYCLQYIEILKCHKTAYNKDKAVEGWRNIALIGARMFNKNYITPGMNIFTTRDNSEVAEWLEEYFLADVMEG